MAELTRKDDVMMMRRQIDNKSDKRCENIIVYLTRIEIFVGAKRKTMQKQKKKNTDEKLNFLKWNGFISTSKSDDA